MSETHVFAINLRQSTDLLEHHPANTMCSTGEFVTSSLSRKVATEICEIKEARQFMSCVVNVPETAFAETHLAISWLWKNNSFVYTKQRIMQRTRFRVFSLFGTTLHIATKFWSHPYMHICIYIDAYVYKHKYIYNIYVHISISIYIYAHRTNSI